MFSGSCSIFCLLINLCLFSGSSSKLYAILFLLVFIGLTDLVRSEEGSGHVVEHGTGGIGVVREQDQVAAAV